MRRNMKGRLLRKLKTTWNSTLVFKPNSPLQTMQTSNPHKNHPLPTLTRDNLGVSETSMDDVKDDNSSESKVEENGVVSMHDRVENKEKPSPLSSFEDRCPPGGKDSVVLYTTSLRGIRKTFEDCNTIRFLLESFRVVYSERDVSMHLEYREELWKVLEGRVVPPRVFIRGRYIGGADEVVGLHEKGMLQSLLQGIPLSPSRNQCSTCGGMRFVLCSGCNGSRKVTPEAGGNDGATPVRCPDCNENGLVKCSVCSVF